ARAWSTVTPVVLPGLDDGKHPKAEKLFFAALRHAGFPLNAIAELTLRKAPFWPGAQHPRSYFAPKYLAGLAKWHAHLVFREPVRGPIAIGAGRHVGLGVMAAGEESR
ncbi:MAG: type I-U CRISPR-associated protein Cas5/Cas6, partial [bacterium]|nr:type I-U CRISPR-associated protein Cas5/Cas6 [bacterium]